MIVYQMHALTLAATARLLQITVNHAIPAVEQSNVIQAAALRLLLIMANHVTEMLVVELEQ